MLRAGVDAVGEIPAHRHVAESPLLRFGGCLDRVDGFDAQFFGISAREARVMDPQQRLMLELGWEAFEDARTPPERARGDRVGVFVGAIWDDYATLAHQAGVPIGQHTLTGTHRGIIANRISYALGLTGPSLVVDTGQSSSLVAVHSACLSLWNKESSLALAGGVNLNLAPQSAEEVIEFGALSADGRCFTFDARANGYVRGEGGALVVLKPLTAALADGDRIYASIRGAAVNNDGHTDGLTVPGERAQEELLRAAYARAGVEPGDVDYVELHGSATKVGDPIEAAALGAVFGQGRSARQPLRVGSVKTNIGHLEGAAGIAGLVKTALSLANRELPPSLHFVTPNPRIPLERLRLRVQDSRTGWPRAGIRLRAGVSSFGMGGTNCHLVLEEAPEAAADQTDPGTGVVPVPLSAASAGALRDAAHALADLPHRQEITPADLGYSLARTRARLRQRAVVLAEDRAELDAGLGGLADRKPVAQLVRGEARDTKLAFVFSGQGGQRAGMGKKLYARFPVFAEAFDAVCAEFDRRHSGGFRLREIAWSEDTEPLGRTDYAQAAIFAVQIGLYRLFESWGIRPDFVVGHSLGELAAAHSAGAYSLADAVSLLVTRARLMQSLPSGGAMASLRAGVAEIRPLIEDTEVDIAAVNGRESVVIAGADEAVERVCARFAALGREPKLLSVSHAFHSPLLDPILDELGSFAAGLPDTGPRECGFVSTVTGSLMDRGEAFPAGYWRRQAREPVRFAEALDSLTALSVGLFLEIGPSGELSYLTARHLAESDALVVPGTRAGDEPRATLTALARLHTAGVEPDWRAVFGHRRVVDLPTYRFQREPYWFTDAAPEVPAPAEASTVSITESVRAVIAAVLGVRQERLDEQATFADLGVSSLMATELCERLGGIDGVRVNTSALFDHPTPARLIEYLGERAGDSETRGFSRTSTSGSAEPIAILAMSCRFPGGIDSPGGLWDLVLAEGEAISPLPEDRGWDLAGLADAGESVPRHGGFLTGADRFDNEFFGISPREATAMDPQQRLLLQTAWEAFERAGLDPRGRSDVGVFVGASAQEYGSRLAERGGEHEGYRLTGSTVSVASGRIAYALGLGGPAMTVDTACSSALVAVHLTMNALRTGECSLGLASAATVMSEPGMFVEFAKQGGLAPDGRCKVFAAGADGTAWAEGVGALVLERLSDAERLGHPVLAVLRGSAVNQDGASNGLTAPNGLAQRRVIGTALRSAGLEPADIDVLEAHGTGTRLGDPIEANALLAAYGEGREPSRPLWIGSVKSNIGHTQAAAGIAGIIKMVEAMRAGVVPRSLHLDEPSEHVDWSAGVLAPLHSARSWDSGDHPRRAAVSSFGISGTNAHVVLEQGPTDGPEPLTGPDRSRPFVLSAPTPVGLRAQAGRLREYLASRPAASLADIGRTLATARAVFDHRAVVLAEDRETLLDGLAAIERGEFSPAVVSGRAEDGAVVFVFPGQGAQWPGMARELLADAPVFAERMRECAAAFEPHVEWSLLAVLRGEPGAAPLTRVDVVQPVLFAVMVSLAALWESLGIRADAVLGHSQGELAAACVAGALSLEQAAALVVARSREITRLAGTGGMASIALPAEEVRQHIDGRADVHIAAINGPRSTVLAGAQDTLAGLVTEHRSRGVHARVIEVDYASHTPDVEVLRAALEEQFAGLVTERPRIPWYSAVTGEPVADRLDGGYWYRNMRAPVQFARAVRAAAEQGHRIFVECSPHPVLTLGVEDTLADGGKPGVVVGTLRREEGGCSRVLRSLAEAFVGGARIDWTRLLPEGRTVPGELPTYAFQEKRYWLAGNRPGLDIGTLGLATAGHPMLGAMVELPESGGLVASGVISTRTHPWLAEHAVSGSVLVPATVFAELALSTGGQVGCGQLAELVLESPLVLSERGDAVTIRIELGGPGKSGERPIALCSGPGQVSGETEWVRHAHGSLEPVRAKSVAAAGHWPPERSEPVEVGDCYARLAERGHEYGASFRALRAVWRRDDEIFAEIELPEARRGDGYPVHPALLDAALHALLGFGPSAQETEPSLPFELGGMTVQGQGTTSARVHITPGGSGTVSLALSADGQPVCTVERLVLRPAKPGWDPGALDSLYWLDWIPRDRERSRVHAAVLGAAGLGGPRPYPDLSALRRARDVPELVFTAVDGFGGADPAEDALTVTTGVLELVRRWITEERFAGSRLVFVTRGAVPLDGPTLAAGLGQSAVWGLVRSAQSEHPGRFGLVDVDTDVSFDLLLDAVGTGEPQLAIREGRSLVPRLAEIGTHPGIRLPKGPGNWHLELARQGALDDLVPRSDPAGSRPLEADEVRVEIRAAGVNFRDVVVALGMVPTEQGIGIEGTGVVREVGSAVSAFAPGNRVFGMIEGAFGSSAVADQRRLARVPSDWSDIEAASVPIVYLTAYHGFVSLAGLAAGESVLIHAATGGVGMAAVALACLLGAEVFATASPGKWDTLRAMGIDENHIASSRSLDFEAEFRAASGGRGVDVVLNSLTGEYIDASLRLLAPGGRFIELGKTDIRDPRQLSAEHPGTRYHAFSLPELAPERIATMLAELMDHFAQGRLHPVPAVAADVRRVPGVLRRLGSAAHTGKLVLTVPRSLDPEGTVLITGGTGTLGRLLARRLVTEHGVRNLVLLGRRGPDADGVAEQVEKLARLGAEVQVLACDVSDRAELRRVLEDIPREHPLTGIVHAAGVLDDGLVESLSTGQLSRVFQAKAKAAWLLHELTADTRLAMFVLFSSASGLFGEAGQANYAAANAFLDALAGYRRAHGLPVSCLAWGLWEARGGMTAHLGESDLVRLRRTGMGQLSVVRGLSLFDLAGTVDETVLVPVAVQRRELRSGPELPAVLENLVEPSPSPGGESADRVEGTATLGERLRDMPESDRRPVLLDLVRAEAATVLGYPEAGEVAAELPMTELGFDSLTSVELRNRLNSATGLRLTSNTVLESRTLMDLIEVIGVELAT